MLFLAFEVRRCHWHLELARRRGGEEEEEEKEEEGGGGSHSHKI